MKMTYEYLISLSARSFSAASEMIAIGNFFEARNLGISGNNLLEAAEALEGGNRVKSLTLYDAALLRNQLALLGGPDDDEVIEARAMKLEELASKVAMDLESNDLIAIEDYLEGGSDAELDLALALVEFRK